MHCNLSYHLNILSWAEKTQMKYIAINLYKIHHHYWLPNFQPAFETTPFLTTSSIP